MKTEVIPMVASLSLSCSHHDAPPRSKNSVQQDENVCPDCGATAPVTTSEGFTACSACGCEYPDSQPYVCSDPLGRNKGIIQSHMIARRGMTTMVGTRSERAQSARVFRWADRIGQTFEQEVLQRAYFEIKKILTILDLDPRSALFDTAMTGFAKAYRAIPKGTRNRNVHLLAMVSTYRAMRASRVPVAVKHYITSCLDHAQFSPRQFLTTLNDTTGLFPKINPSEMVPCEVSALVSRLGVPKSIQDAVAIILKHHFNAFRSPKTAVQAAAILGTAIIATGERRRFPLSLISRSAGIATSAVIRCILGACAHNHCPFEGSLVYAGDLFRSHFLEPASEIKIETIRANLVKVQVKKRTHENPLPKLVTNAAETRPPTRADAFLGHSTKAADGPIMTTTIVTTGSRNKYPLKTGLENARGGDNPDPCHSSPFFIAPASIFNAPQTGPPLLVQGVPPTNTPCAFLSFMRSTPHRKTCTIT